MTTPVPERTEAGDYYFTYIDQVPAGDILDVLRAQSTEAVGVLRTIPEERSRYRYAPGKWSMREVIGHVNDTERVFVFRALWFARGFDTPLPSFDQDVAVGQAAADERSWASLVAELDAVRQATVAFFESLPGEAWARRGIASGNPFTVRALAFITAGHLAHHLRMLRERYLTNDAAGAAPAAR